MNLKSISHFSTDPYINMAFDEWMLEKVLFESNTILLRLYSWSIGAITFGYNQHADKAFIKEQLGDTPAIRRITGGRAIYHDQSEITYAIAVSADLEQKGPFGESIIKASSEIAGILVEFLGKEDITSDFMRHSSPHESERSFFHKAPCFASYAKNEILSNNKKIIASAQRRVSGAFVQHGAIKINGIASHPALEIQRGNSMTGREIKPLRESDFMVYNSHFQETFEDYFQAPFEKIVLTRSEQNRVKEIKEAIKKNSIEKRYIIKQNA